MLAFYLFILMFTNSINQIQKNIHSTFINRITILTLLLSILYTYNTLYFQLIGKGMSIYSGLFQITIQSQIVEMVLILVGISILFAWPFLYVYCSARSSKHDNALTSYLKAKHVSSSLLTKEAIENSSLKEDDKDLKIIDLSIKTSCAPQQYSLIAIFSILGGSLLMSSLDLLSMYLSIELQSFALYILATLNKERLSATSAGLKYFLLGSLSSCFILLGSAIIYNYTGLTQFESINTLMSIPTSATPHLYDIVTSWQSPESSLAYFASGSELNTETLENNYTYYAQDIKKAFTIGLIIIIIGFLFKISAAPFYQWAPDVYDGTPTIVTVWLTIVVKLTILIFLLGLIEYTIPDLFSIYNTIYETLNMSNTNASQIIHNLSTNDFLPLTAEVQIKNLLLICSLLSLLIGTIVGLSQIKFKRLLAFSSISHVGFLLLALGIYTQKSIDSFLFYLIQYSVTSLNIFLILLAFSYFIILPNFKLNPNLNIDKTNDNNTVNSFFKNELKKKVKRQMFILDDITDSLIPNNTTKSIEEIASLTLSENSKNTAVSSSLLIKEAIENNSLNKDDKNLNIPDFTSTKANENVGSPIDINYIIELKGQLYKNPILSISMAICLFSMAGVPPLIGFFSKQYVLFSSIENGYNLLSIIAILVSVISASYYLRIIKITFFDSLNVSGSLFTKEVTPFLKTGSSLKEENYIGSYSSQKYAPAVGWNKQFSYSLIANLSETHSYIIAILTFLILFFFLDPSILLNGTQLISLTLFNI